MVLYLFVFNTLIKLQKMAARLILDVDYTDPSTKLCKILKWLPIDKKVRFRQATLVYKALNDMTPSYMTDMFTSSSETAPFNLRYVSNNTLFIPRTHRKSLCFLGPKLCNSLSTHSRKDSTLSQLKKIVSIFGFMCVNTYICTVMYYY